ncbi:MAG: hypothetical protein E7620_00230 [Ruminococcaceae bacterium]|nr:hypothetical protein [Oscillospiraceae bacterium]
MKRMLLRIMCLSITALILLLSTACGASNGANENAEPTASADSSPTQATEPKTEQTTAPQTEEPRPMAVTYPISEIYDKLKLHGRTQLVSGGLACDFTASGIEFSVCAEGAVELKVQPTKDAYFTVWIDGVRQEQRFYAPVGSATLTLANFSDGQFHTVRVLKQTEAQFSLCLFQSLSFLGELGEKPAESDTYIEFIGDSILCGHGNLCLNGEQGQGTALYEDGTIAFAYLTSEALGADCSIVSCSGVGLDKGFTSFKATDFYPMQSYYRNSAIVYDFSRTPDLVVINLGTNDQTKGSAKAAVMEGVTCLIGMVREKYGRVNIVWTYNMMGDNNVIPWIREAIEALGGEGAGLYLCELNRDRQGGNGHPTEDGHLIAARKLRLFLQEKNLLT